MLERLGGAGEVAAAGPRPRPSSASGHGRKAVQRSLRASRQAASSDSSARSSSLRNNCVRPRNASDHACCFGARPVAASCDRASVGVRGLIVCADVAEAGARDAWILAISSGSSSASSSAVRSHVLALG